MNIRDYQTIIFDCDGVILDSNHVKTNAFYVTGLEFGVKAAKELVKYHTQFGGVSRYHKFKYFIDNILDDDNSNTVNIDDLLAKFSQETLNGLRTCRINPDIAKIYLTLPNTHSLVVSGGDQVELRNIFSERGLLKYFSGGIFGSPSPKDKILNREIKNSNIKFPAVYIGDSRYDYIVSKDVGLDFIFLSKWTEFSDWEEYQKKEGFTSISELSELLSI